MIFSKPTGDIIWSEEPYTWPYTTTPPTKCPECGDYFTNDPTKHPCGPLGFLAKSRRWQELNSNTPMTEPKYLDMTMGQFELGEDGWVRCTYSNWELPNSGSVMEELEKASGAKFKFFGCFMDTICLGTRDESVIGKEFRIRVKR